MCVILAAELMLTAYLLHGNTRRILVAYFKTTIQKYDANAYIWDYLHIKVRAGNKTPFSISTSYSNTFLALQIYLQYRCCGVLHHEDYWVTKHKYPRSCCRDLPKCEYVFEFGCYNHVFSRKGLIVSDLFCHQYVICLYIIGSNQYANFDAAPS